MRTAFIETLYRIAEKDDRIWLLTGDLGFSVLEKFATRFPDRFLNAGVAEQNMTGVAAGLAACGKVVFTYSIANFPTLRCLEQIRNDVCYHQADVKIVAVGGGLAYGSAGYSHHAVEDLAIMQALPNMTVFAPGDSIETELVTEAAVGLKGPCYLRLDKASKAQIHEFKPHFEVGKAIVVRSGEDATIVSTGTALSLAVEASMRLAEIGVSTRVLSMPTLKPFDADAVVRAARETGKIITVEEHGTGGLGTLVGETLAVAKVEAEFIPLRLGAVPVSTAGSQARLRASHRLSVDVIVERVRCHL